MSNIDQVIKAHRDMTTNLCKHVVSLAEKAATKDGEKALAVALAEAIANTASDISTIAVCMRSIALSLEKLSEKSSG